MDFLIHKHKHTEPVESVEMLSVHNDRAEINGIIVWAATLFVCVSNRIERAWYRNVLYCIIHGYLGIGYLIHGTISDLVPDTRYLKAEP